MFANMDRYRFNRGINKSRHLVYKSLIGDRRCVFNDHSKVKPEDRVVKSSIINFYSSIENIGNFMPVLGIQKMLQMETDTWCIHDYRIDYDFINKNYKAVIIGGAGLAVQDPDGRFERFWRRFEANCKLPTIIWGVGTDDVWKISDAYKEAVSVVAKRCDLINVRDDLTAETFNMTNADISPCPTVVYLQKFLGENESQSPDYNKATFVRYPHQLYEKPVVQTEATIRKYCSSLKKTTNHQYSFLGLDDIIEQNYVNRGFVVTSMLHAAITSYGLGLPYIAITKTQKISAFQERFGNGLSIKTPQELEDVLKSDSVSKMQLKPIEIDPIVAFGNQARSWVSSVCY